MSKSVALALASAFVLAACAAAQNGGSTKTATGAQYCWKDKLSVEGDAMVCNWAPSRQDACRFEAHSTLKKASVASGPRDAGRCENGQWLVQVTTK